MTRVVNSYKIIILTTALLSLLSFACDEKVVTTNVIPVLTISTTYEEFEAPIGGPSPNFFFVHVDTDNGDKVDFSFSENSTWLELANASGVPFGKTADSFLVTMSITTPQFLDVGTYVDSIRVVGEDVSNGPLYLKIQITIVSIIKYNPPSLSFAAGKNGFSPAAKFFKVSSISSEQFSYTLQTSSSWLNLDRQSGVTSADDSIRVDIDITGLVEGEYVDSIVIASDGIFNSPRYIICELEISPWLEQDSPEDGILLDVHFTDDKTGWAVGLIADEVTRRTAYIIRTTDAGNNWQTNYLAETYQNRTTLAFGAVQFFGQVGWVCGEEALIFNTLDNGLTWDIIGTQFDNSNIDFNDLHFISAHAGWIVCDSGYILNTMDGGQSWNIIPSGVTQDLFSIHFVDSQNGWVAGGEDVILKTTDGGLTWVKQIIPPSPLLGTAYDFNEIFFSDIDHGWAVGKLGYVLITTDAGLSWLPTKLNVGNKLSTVIFVDNMTGWVGGEDGLVMHTTDGGENWLPQFTNTINWINSIYFHDENTGWTVGNNGTIRYTGSGGD